ncbi:juvenile hormone-binding protein-like [Pararge aegeria]|uniref:Jg21095 protein n=2 Tax=Pararge aegeria TaxID=116150 RepID=A0A8S4RK97_9NEOP|nr:juvenile hormone-binding protein-like [Pararge aegeria]CAH2238390.1 jg21095 [Pararge aegeria aegeria]
MVRLSAFLLLFYSASVLTDGGSLLTPCKVDDTECLSKTTQQFLEKTCQGIPEYDIKPIDPLFIPDLDIVVGDDLETKLHYKNLTITGLKNQQFSDMKMDTEAKSVVLQTRADLNIIGTVIVELSKIHKSITGSYTLKGTALGTSRYGYGFRTDDKGIEHYEVGPETISCQTVNEPEVTLGPELREAIEQDDSLKEKKENFKKKELQKLVFCKMVEKAYVTVVHNIRAAAKILPKSAFLDGV